MVHTMPASPIDGGEKEEVCLYPSLTSLDFTLSVPKPSLLAEVLVQDAIQKLRILLQLLHDIGGLLLCQVAIADSLIQRTLESIDHNCMQLRG